MKLVELLADVRRELNDLERTVQDSTGLLNHIGEREPTVYEQAGLALMLAQWYNGVENILKRVSKYHAVRLPVGEDSHLQLFLRFCNPPTSPLPMLFPDHLREGFSIFRRFRHFTYHGYSLKIEWAKLILVLESLMPLWNDFKYRIESYLETLER
jgi:hypothetical protein